MSLLASLAGCTPPGPAEFDVTEFGAVADGVTDSVLSIQSAIEAAAEAGGGRVIFPGSSSPYLISQGLTIRSSSIVLDGPGAHILLPGTGPIDNQPAMILAEGAENNPIRDVSIQGLTVDANFFAQPEGVRRRGIEFRFVEGARVTDVTLARVYVGLDFGRGSVDGEARRVTVTNYAEDGFDAGGDANEFSGGAARDIRFRDVVARDAPRSRRNGNAFEIEDGAQGVLIENATVENVGGNGVGLRNHRSPGKDNHSHDVELHNVTIRGVGGAFAVWGRCAPQGPSATNSYHRIRLVDVKTEAPVAFAGPIQGLLLRGGNYGQVLLGFDQPDGDPSPELAVSDAAVEDLEAQSIRINGTRGQVTLTNVALPENPGALEVEGSGAEIRIE